MSRQKTYKTPEEKLEAVRRNARNAMARRRAKAREWGGLSKML